MTPVLHGLLGCGRAVWEEGGGGARRGGGGKGVWSREATPFGGLFLGGSKPRRQAEWRTIFLEG